MHSFVKNVLPLLFLLLTFSDTLASTILDGVELDSGYRNDFTHMNWNSAGVGGGWCECCRTAYSNFRESEGTEDWYVTWTYTGGGRYRICSTDIVNSVSTPHFIGYPPEGGYICSSCTVSNSYNSGERCSDVQFDTIIISAGSVTINNYQDYPPVILKAYEMCSLPPPPSYRGYSTLKRDSSYTFRIKCEGEKIARILRIEANVLITSEREPSGKEFLINVISPFYIQKSGMLYSESERVYYWWGRLKWDIPIYKRCGESITVTPSLTSGYGYTRSYPFDDSSIKAIFDCPVDVNVTPSVVMPKKTGNNIADVAATLSNPAPSGGVNVKLTVETGEYLGGHSHDGSRPKGEITDNDGNKIDTIFFAEGETQKQVKYKASEVSGEEKIIAEIEGGGRCEKTVRVQVPGLIELSEGDGYGIIELIGQTSSHPGNHYGTENAKFSLLDLASAYLETEKGTLRINDISLIWGGLFDWDVMNTPWRPPHKSHRIGKNVDVDDKTAEGKTITKKSLIKIIDDLDINVTVLDEGNHFHLTFP